MKQDDEPPARPRFECTVVVPTHQGAHRLPKLLDALTVQDYDEPWEVIVVVDGVLDTTVDILAAYRDLLPLRTLIHQEPRGIVLTMNEGITAARGRIVIRCDDDLTPGSSFLSFHMRHHNGERPVGVIGPTRDVFPNSAYARAYGIPANERALAASYSRNASYRWVGWAANNSVPREVLLTLGGFDPRFVYGQDSELGYRIASRGIPIAVDPDLETPHRGPSTNVESRAARAFVSGASRRLFESLHPEAHPPAQVSGNPKALIWNAAALSVAWVLRTHASYARVGKSIDRVLPWLPRSLTARTISLLVESAGRSGRANGRSDLSVYKRQKRVELAHELSPMTD